MDECALETGLFRPAVMQLVKLASTLTNLFLHNNHLEGTVPTEIALLVGLERLDLSSNHLSGQIPSQIGVSVLSILI